MITSIMLEAISLAINNKSDDEPIEIGWGYDWNEIEAWLAEDDDQIEDDWISLSDEWDLNVFEEEGELKATLYPIKDGQVDVLDGRPVKGLKRVRGRGENA